MVGLTQFRIKRLFAYSTISHVGYMLLALGICTSIESTQAFIFYLTQYSIVQFKCFCYNNCNRIFFLSLFFFLKKKKNK